MSEVTAWPLAPSQGRAGLPPAVMLASTALTILDGMAKPMPTEPPF